VAALDHKLIENPNGFPISAIFSNVAMAVAGSTSAVCRPTSAQYPGDLLVVRVKTP
jgi:hypothetical protein